MGANFGSNRRKRQYLAVLWNLAKNEINNSIIDRGFLMKTGITAILASTVAALALSAQAETLRWASAGDALTLDPHSQNEGQTHTIRHQMYEALIIRDVTGAFEAALATEWNVEIEPQRHFTRRRGHGRFDIGQLLLVPLRERRIVGDEITADFGVGCVRHG